MQRGVGAVQTCGLRTREEYNRPGHAMCRVVALPSPHYPASVHTTLPKPLLSCLNGCSRAAAGAEGGEIQRAERRTAATRSADRSAAAHTC